MADIEARDLNDRLDRLAQSIAEVVGDVRVIRAMVETESQRCVYREKIDQAVSVIKRVEVLETRLVQLEVRVAGIAVLAGIVVSLITTLVVQAFKGSI